MIITQTPFRMSFFGGGTDMESFFRENGGSAFCLSLPGKLQKRNELNA